MAFSAEKNNFILQEKLEEQKNLILQEKLSALAKSKGLEEIECFMSQLGAIIYIKPYEFVRFHIEIRSWSLSFINDETVDEFLNAVEKIAEAFLNNFDVFKEKVE